MAVFEQALPELEQHTAPVGFGMYLSAAVVTELERDAGARRAWLQAARQSRWPIWTANAFPFGGFHGDRVKELAFEPDWRKPERLGFTIGVARLLAELLEPGEQGSLSTCPLGYGADARNDPQSLRHLEKLARELDRLAEQTGVELSLAIEPEPEGGFGRVSDLATWLGGQLADPRIGICWDLCHSAVVGESTAEALEASAHHQVSIAKVQVSAALQTTAEIDATALPLLEAIAADRYFHQVRGEESPSGAPLRSPDLIELCESPDWGVAWLSQRALRVHCHVPLHVPRFAPGLLGTAWREAVTAAQAAGVRDFEVETYTLPILPEALLDQAPGCAGGEAWLQVLAAEIAAAHAQISLDTGPTEL